MKEGRETRLRTRGSGSLRGKSPQARCVFQSLPGCGPQRKEAVTSKTHPGAKTKGKGTAVAEWGKIGFWRSPATRFAHWLPWPHFERHWKWRLCKASAQEGKGSAFPPIHAGVSGQTWTVDPSYQHTAQAGARLRRFLCCFPSYMPVSDSAMKPAGGRGWEMDRPHEATRLSKLTNKDGWQPPTLPCLIPTSWLPCTWLPCTWLPRTWQNNEKERSL